MAKWLKAFIAAENVGKEVSNSSIFPTTPFSPYRFVFLTRRSVLFFSRTSRGLSWSFVGCAPILLAASFTFTHREWFTLVLSVGLWIHAQRDVQFILTRRLEILTQKSGMFSRVFGCWV